jgi:hypothetical protein
MRTEDLHVPPTKPAADSLTSALLSAYPHRCQITTESGKEAPLSLAGFVLSFGKTYHIRFAEPIKSLRLAGFPNHLIRIQNEPTSNRKHETTYRIIPIRVGFPGWWDKLTHHGIYPHDLEVEIEFDGGRKSNLSIPVVLQLGVTASLFVTLILFATCWAILELFRESAMQGGLQTVQNASKWYWAVGLALLYPLWRMPKQLWTMWWRARELKAQFNARWLRPQVVANSASRSR